MAKPIKQLQALKRSMEDPAIRREMWRNSKAPAPGMFSTLDELIQAAPIADEATAKQWEEYLRPGRALQREDVTFPLKQEEIDYTNLKPFLENLKRQNALLNRNVLLDYVRQERPEFRGEIGTPNVSSTLGEFMSDDLRPQETRFRDKYHAGGEDIDDQSGLTGRVLAAQRPKFGHDSLHTSATAVPGSYEEMITRLDGLHQGYSSHFGADGLSWSRATQQPVNLDSQKMRYIEEIQSDLHSRAGEKLRRVPSFREDPDFWHKLQELDPEGQRPSAMFGSSMNERYIDEPNWTAAQRYTTDPTLREFLDKVPVVRRGYYKNINRQVRDFAKARGVDDIEEAYRLFDAEHGIDAKKLAEMENEYIVRGAVPDAPFKSPADHGLLELKKQMLNAARQGDDYLGIIPGSEQIKRYEQGMDERRRGGMEYIYDKVYPGQLEKLARQYGIETETVGLQTSNKADLRPPELVEHDIETPSEFVHWFEDSEDDPDAARALHDSLLELYENRYKTLEDISPEHRAVVESYVYDPNNFVDRLGRGVRVTRSPLAQRLMLALDAMDDEYRRSVAYEVGDGSGFTTLPVPAMRLTPEAREKIKRIGVPLWTLPAAAAGAEAVLRGEEEPQGYATGGLIKQAEKAKARAADRLGELIERLKAKNAFVGQRAERVLDEEPGMDKMLSPEGLRRLAEDPAPVIMAKPGEYRKWAQPFYGQNVRENGVPDIDRDMALELLVKMSESGGMRGNPLIFGQSWGEPNVLRVQAHNGRHRALGVGEIMGMKTPVQLAAYDRWPRIEQTPTSMPNRHKWINTTTREETRADPYDGGDPNYTFAQPDVTQGDLTEKLQQLLDTLNTKVDTIEQQNDRIGQPDRSYKIKPDRWFADGGVVEMAGGGSVAEALARLAKRSKFGKLRAERLMDEDPGFANVLAPEAINDLVENPAPIAVLTPDEFAGIARPLHMGKAAQLNIRQLKDSIAASGLIEPAHLGLEVAGANVLQAFEHQGRHRTEALRRLNSKVPTQIDDGNGGVSSTMIERIAREGELEELEDEGDIARYNRLVNKPIKRPTIYSSELRDALLEALEDLNTKSRVRPEPEVGSLRSERSVVDIGKGRFFADGGAVERVKKVDRVARKAGFPGESEERRARLASAMMANLMSMDEDGEVTNDVLPRFDVLEGGFTWPNKPGLVDGTLALGELLGVGGAITEGSGDRYNALVARLQELQGLKEAESFPEHLTEALGSMLTQVPVAGATKAMGPLRAAAEYISPQVVPKASNYLAGAAAGGTLSKALQELNERVSEGPSGEARRSIRAPSLEWDPGR